MTEARRRLIGRAFSAAHDYDRNARVQRRVAEDLAVRIAQWTLPPNPRILEIGCGTGFLSEALMARGVNGQWLMTDLSPDMVERCRQRIGTADDRQFAVLDGEHGAMPEGGPFDLICSSMAMQWFDALNPAIARLRGWLAPGGHLALTTLGAGTFAQWRQAHAEAGAVAATPNYPAVGDLPADGRESDVTVERYDETFASARAFLRALKAIGATTAQGGHQPLTPAMLRRVMHHFEQTGASVTYEVLTGHYRAETRS